MNLFCPLFQIKQINVNGSGQECPLYTSTYGNAQRLLSLAQLLSFGIRMQK